MVRYSLHEHNWKPLAELSLRCHHVVVAATVISYGNPFLFTPQCVNLQNYFQVSGELAGCTP